MNAITKIQIEFGESATPISIPVRQVSCTASRLPGLVWVDSWTHSVRSNQTPGSQAAAKEKFIARIHEVLHKRGAR